MSIPIQYRRAALYFFAGCIALAAIHAGFRLRDAVWAATENIHYRGDLDSAHKHGNQIILNALEFNGGNKFDGVPSWPSVFQSYLNYYDWIIDQHPDGRLNLDYPPLRLLTMCIWSRSVYVPGEDPADTDINLCQPLLNLNTVSELLAAVAAFLLVRHWLTCGEAPDDKSHRGWIGGLLAAALVWFDPSLLLDAHGWPQWDAWVVPFYLFAAWAASTERWFTAGIILAVGGAAKGQLWVAAPILLLWPVFAWRWMSFFRISVGTLVGLACIQSIWTLSIPSARLWIGGCFIAMLIAFAGGRWFERYSRVLFSLVAGAIIIWPWASVDGDWTLPGALVLATMMVLMVWRIPAKSIAIRWSVLMAAAVLLASAHYSASLGWFKVGIVFGANRNEEKLFAGIANNLPALLNIRFGWQSPDEMVAGFPITLGQLLQGLYAIGLVACASALANHARRKSPRALLAIATPWVLFYALMPQMRERYLLWGGVVSAVWIGMGVAPILLHLLITALSFGTILHVMLKVHREAASPTHYRLLTAMHPDSGWLVLIVAAVCLYLTLMPDRKRHPSGLTASRAAAGPQANALAAS